MKSVICSIASVAAHNLNYRTFRHIDCTELQAITGLSESAAALAKQRTGSMPLLWEDSDEALETFSEALGFIGLQIVKEGLFTRSSTIPAAKPSA